MRPTLRLAPALTLAAALSAILAAGPASAGVADQMTMHAPFQGGAVDLGRTAPACPTGAAMTLTLNGVCVGVPTNVEVAKSQPGPAGGSAWSQTPDPKIIVVEFGAPLSPALASWAAAGGPAGTVVITTWGPGHTAERTTTLDGATPAGVTAGTAPKLTLHYQN